MQAMRIKIVTRFEGVRDQGEGEVRMIVARYFCSNVSTARIVGK
jgi:hypothetical protein